MTSVTHNPVLVVGAQRSGTTILGALMSDHPEVFLTVNGKLLYYLITWIYRDPAFQHGNHLRLDEIAHSLERKHIIGLTFAELVQFLHRLTTDFPPEKCASLSPAQVIRSIWGEIYGGLAQDRRVVGDKYNEYLLQLREIRDLFPDCRYVFIHREPADVAESMIRAFHGRPWAPSDPALALRKWADWNKCWLDQRADIPARNRYEVSYRALVERPTEVFADICDMLDITYSPEYAQHVQRRLTKPSMGGGSRLELDWARLHHDIPHFNEVCQALGYGYNER